MPYFDGIVNFLHDDVFMALFRFAYDVAPNAAAASAAAVAGVLLAVWLFFRAIFFAIAWMKGETRV
ncbi:MAG: hypothetical protein ACR2QC_10645 [Gammaproteobacteria bacterium]